MTVPTPPGPTWNPESQMYDYPSGQPSAPPEHVFAMQDGRGPWIHEAVPHIGQPYAGFTPDPAPKRKRRWPLILGGSLAALVLLGGVGAAISGGDKQGTAKTAPTPAVGTGDAPLPSYPADGEQETTPPPPNVTTSTGPLTIGSKASFEWTDGLEVWVVSAKRVVNKPDQYSDTERFVGVTVKVKNGTGEQVDLSGFSVRLRYGAAGTEAENAYVTTEGYDGLNGRVAVGKTVSSGYAFTVPGRALPIAVEINPGYDSEYSAYESAFFEGKV